MAERSTKPKFNGKPSAVCPTKNEDPFLKTEKRSKKRNPNRNNNYKTPASNPQKRNA